MPEEYLKKLLKRVKSMIESMPRQLFWSVKQLRAEERRFCKTLYVRMKTIYLTLLTILKLNDSHESDQLQLSTHFKEQLDQLDFLFLSTTKRHQVWLFVMEETFEMEVQKKTSLISEKFEEHIESQFDCISTM